MEKKQQIKAAIYAALLEAGRGMKDDIKTVSWFGRNHTRPIVVPDDEVVILEVA